MKIINNILIMITILTFAACEKKKANFYVKSDLLKYNSVIAGETYDTSFYIYNTGTDTLCLFNHTCTCECTTLNLKDDQKINPKDSFLLKLKINIDSASIAKSRQVQCTFKSNTDSIFNRLEIRYTTK
jgi:hypothetical protein